MTKTTEEQTTPTEEQKSEESSDPKEEVSKEEEVVSEETTEGEAVYTFKTEEDLKTHMAPLIETAAQSKKDIELAPLQQTIGDLKKENTKLSGQLKVRAEDSALDKLEAKQVGGYAEEPALPEFMVVQRDNLKRGREIERVEVGQLEIGAGLETKAAELDARFKALAFYMPEDKDFLESINTLEERLLSVKTDSERKLVIENMELRLKAEKDSKPKKTTRSKPDATVTTATTEVDTSKLTPDERIKRGIRGIFKEE